MPLIKLKISSDARKRLRRGVFFIIVITVFLLLNKIQPIAKITQNFQAGLGVVATSVGKFYTDTIAKKDDLRREVKKYQSLSAQLSIDQNYMKELERRIKELETLLEYQDNIEISSITARVLARSAKGEHTILIDQGSANGIRQNLAVIIEEGHMIGFTKDVRSNTSTVILLENPSSKIPVAILGTDKTVGLVEGRGGFLLHMGFIPQDEEISQDNVVVTSGLDGNFPSGLVIGVINELIQNETSSFKEALIEPIFDARFYSTVFILDPLRDAYVD